MRLFSFILLAFAMASPAQAQNRAREVLDLGYQRAAVEDLTACIADAMANEVRELLVLDQLSKPAMKKLEKIVTSKTASQCLSDIPAGYRTIGLDGRVFAGGLAERLIKQSEEPLMSRLNMAVIGVEPETLSLQDTIAMCVVRGAPHMVADMLATPINSAEEEVAIGALMPVADMCVPKGQKLEATPFGMRSILALAAYRLLAAQNGEIPQW